MDDEDVLDHDEDDCQGADCYAVREYPVEVQSVSVAGLSYGAILEQEQTKGEMLTMEYLAACATVFA